MQIFKTGDAYAQESEQLTSGTLNLRQLLGRGRAGLNAGDAEQGPDAFLASFLPNEPGASIPRHTYPFPQFQVVVDGEATVGRHLVRPGSFHYSDAGSVSGPITPLDPEIGLTYFTLRPDNASRLAQAVSTEGQGSARTRRSIIGSRIHSELHTEIVVSELVGPEDDGLGVSAVTVPGKATFTPPSLVSHGGQYLLVVEGALSHAGTNLAAGSLVYLASGETADFTAAREGSEILLLQFPTIDSV
ncbi:hypothetical protein [Arthrobacter nitrophenolicus]|uniref:Quercetin 2,3-dioxygenase C-terminal cupin domain-containing protein n=1 Tax=Arthrobacter nitrophenolicus TaxID=683150 RepID=A0A4R5Y7D2_9MICC|nr:hypothetical protein [Arthrobacter nitrophenolicus]TDL39677.1 hypothetical protein E2R57_04150 [Arthrobacter nitrophenolicus]